MSACVSQTSSHSAQHVWLRGRRYSVRHQINGQQVKLSDTFMYQVVGVFGDAKGRAVVFQPVHSPRLVIAFRGVRNRGRSPEEDAEGPAWDRFNMANVAPTSLPWAPDGEAWQARA